MKKLIVLGTGNAVVTKCYNTCFTIYDGNLNVYAHAELIEKIKAICGLVLAKKFTNLFEDRIKFIEVKNDEQKQIMNMNFRFFDIYSTKEKQFGFVLETEEEKITFLGDEPLNKEKCEKYIEGADWLLSEAFCRYEEREKYKPYEKHHSTVKDAAEIAQRFGVKNLLLWHTEDDNIKTRKELYTEEAEQYFDGKVYVPDDLEEIDLC